MFEETTFADPLLERVRKENRQTQKHLEGRTHAMFEQRRHPFHMNIENEMMAEETNESLHKVLSDLQHKFSGRQQDIAHFIEAEVRARTEELYRRAHFDALTHLPNRPHFQELLEKMIATSAENKLGFTLLFLDLDGFKAVNDTLGHGVGDELLRHVGARLVSSVRSEDIVARLGGDEFVVLLTNSTDDRATIEMICQRIINEVSRSYFFEGKEVCISTSIGIGLYPRDGQTAADLMTRADEALYSAKHSGKRNFRFYVDIKDRVPEERHQKIALLTEAIDSGDIKVRVQPQIDLTQNKIVGGCLQMVWNSLDSDDALEWMTLLAQTQREESVGLWLLDTACFYAHQWQQKYAEFVVTVPLMESLLRSESIVTLLHERMERFKVAPTQLQLALSLKSLAKLDDFFIQRVKTLQTAGFQVTLTDLGAVPLDLNLMAKLNVQEFRLDAHWLKKQMITSEGQQWAQGLIQLMNTLDACVIATGIETEDEYLRLKQWGCSYGQGRFWSEDIPIRKFGKLIA